MPPSSKWALAAEVRMLNRSIVVCAALFLGGCSFLPALAPTSNMVLQASDEDWSAYFVKVNGRVVRELLNYRDPGFPPALRVSQYTPSNALKPGDLVGVAVYETGSPALFGPSVPPLMTGIPGQAAPQSTSLPIQTVESDGRITIPYVGRVAVGGKTPGQAAALIKEGLSGQTANPQVVVSLVGTVGNTVSVGGEVNKAGLMPLTLRGERLLDVIAWAGGPKWAPVQVDVRLMRGKRVFSIPLRQVMANPEDNIVASPNDSISLIRNPKTFLVMGATQKVSQYPFELEKYSVAEALAVAGGGVDALSNLAGIYLFRYEPSSFARKLLAADRKAVDASHVKVDVEPVEGGPPTPVMYQIDLTKGDGYFLTQQMPVHDKDIILVTNSDSVQFLKFMQVVRALTGAYYDLTRSTNN